MARLSMVLIVFVLLLGAPSVAPAQTAAGWKTEVNGGKVTLTPTDLADGETYQITIYPRASMNGAQITNYVDAVADRMTETLGKPVGTATTPKAQNHTRAVTNRLYTTPQGVEQAAIYVAIAADGENARIVRILSSVNLLGRYQTQNLAVVNEMQRQEEAAAKESGRGVMTEQIPNAPPGMTPGGKIVPGIYAGDGIYSGSGEIAQRVRLYLYASGECRLCNEKGEEYQFGTDHYTYDPVTGELDVGQQYDIYNSVLGSDDAFSLYGQDADGKPYLYARSDHGFRFETTILRYIGPPDRLSPQQEAAKKAADEAEAKRYKYVTPPGQGVQSDQIAGVLHHYQVRIGMGAALNESYLLLKDGTVHDGLPVPPDELDVSLSRRREPEKWGHWKRADTTILAAWPDQPSHYEALPGVMAIPGSADERLTGHFATGQTSGSMLLGGSYSVWGVKFTPDRRFLKDSQGGASSGTMAQTLNDFSVNTQYDDEGSSTAFSSPGAVGYTTKKHGSSRAGTYTISGYTLTLRYNNGRVERIPFFFESSMRDQIYFEGATLALDDGK